MATTAPAPPGSTCLLADTQARISRIVRGQGGRADALIEVLHRVQELMGYLSQPALEQVARELQLPLSRVYGVASFYHLFRLQAPSAHRCAVCLGTACFVKGGAELAALLERRLALRLGDPAGNGTWALEPVSCLGACGQAPVLVVDGQLEARLPVDAPEQLARRLDALALGQSRPGAGGS
ncbi:NAD(P)H-dependent oxidoreductase subunit E [Cyanobium sp. NIES-981]|uniref:NAD(P)H-dependent oxidoreductase subunit E n=1 Tax=Cyanobium sp. NIES-981 TaxID=1851505 RepID=UPI0007DD549F|nr:NAD(P)H-dependent oxidoreductase subunit E [Cyanobium sp. NIES-981]SBO43417.1 putative NADH dehydrogenase (Ubiquinone) flavoprotein 2 [Cyanobium sp. NIES-981]